MTDDAAVVEIRSMRWWDVDAVMVLERSLFPDPWTAATFWSELAGVPTTRRYVVAETDHGLVGYAGLLVTGDQADVQTLAVAASDQRRGTGRRLLAGLVTEACARGAAALMLEVRADNEPALRLYESEGFERLALRRRYYPNGGDAIVMRRRLVAS